MLVNKRICYGINVMLEYIPIKKHKGGFIEYDVYRIDQNGQRTFIYKECADDFKSKGSGFYV